MLLNGWLRLGIALSIIWAIGAAIYQRNADVERADNFVKWSDRVCHDTKAIEHDTDLSSCEKQREANTATWLKGSYGDVAFMALAPIPVAWLAVFVLWNIGRGAVIGFRPVVPWVTLTLPKKAFVAFSILATAAAVLFAVTMVLNLYVDSQVPVALGLHSLVIQTGDNLVTAEGTWTRQGVGDGSKMAYPLQTSHINCDREKMLCVEARASVSGNLLTSKLVEYEVESWSATTVLMKNEAPCATEVFSIDLKTKTVNGEGHLTNKDGEFCKRFGKGDEDHWSYRLSDGFKVYWEERQKARPLVLRLIQTLFGY